MSVLAGLKSLGLRLALDDFGTGYCSLDYLRRFPVDTVKIDRGFVAEIGRDPASTAIVTAVTSLAHVLGLGVVAEGVETEQQRDEVVAIGCQFAQGFLYAPPLSGPELSVQLALDPGRPMCLPRAAGRPPDDPEMVTETVAASTVSVPAQPTATAAVSQQHGVS